MTEWREVTLGDLGRVQSGFAFKSHDWTTSGVPVIKIQNVRSGRVNAKGCSFVSSAVADAADPYELSDGDVLVTMSGEIGSVGIVRTEDRMMLNQRVGRVRLHHDDPVLLRFIGYGLQHPELKSAMEMISYGVAQPNISPALLASMPISLPPAEAQRAIVGVLDAIDDLIENNRRRVEVLEEMARAIYREWFVRFRYPGYEDFPLVDSPLGPIPDGWESLVVSDITDPVTRGVAPKYADDGAWTVINQKCIRDERLSLEKARRQERTVPSTKQVKKGDVLINSTGVGTLGRAAFCLTDHPSLTVDTHVTIVRPSVPAANPWFGLGLVCRQVEFEQLGTGSTGQTELSRSDIGAMPLLVPPEPIRLTFADPVWPLLKCANALLDQNRFLAALRDLLLPKLVTGKIDVSHLDLDALIEAATA